MFIWNAINIAKLLHLERSNEFCTWKSPTNLWWIPSSARNGPLTNSTISSLCLSRNSWTVHVKWLPVSTSWCIVGLRIQQKASRYGGYLPIGWVAVIDERPDSGPPVWCLWEELTILIDMSRNITQGLQLGIFENDSLQNIGWACLECIHLVQYGGKCRAILNLVKKFQNP